MGKKGTREMILTCGCKSEHGGIFCEWDTETRECEPATAYGVLCSKHYHEYEARPTAQEKARCVNTFPTIKTKINEQW